MLIPLLHTVPSFFGIVCKTSSNTCQHWFSIDNNHVHLFRLHQFIPYTDSLCRLNWYTFLKCLRVDEYVYIHFYVFIIFRIQCLPYLLIRKWGKTKNKDRTDIKNIYEFISKWIPNTIACNAIIQMQEIIGQISALNVIILFLQRAYFDKISKRAFLFKTILSNDTAVILVPVTILKICVRYQTSPNKI